MSALDLFRAETRDWLAANCPPTMRTRMVSGEEVNGGRKKPSSNPEAYLWLQRMLAKGWTVPTWPRAYGGADLSKDEFLILLDELRRINARPPLMGMGVSMIGPTLLEYGTDDQKQRHLPPIAAGELAWCQGYSEPGAGSDLASLSTRADDVGDHYRVNGAKIWTSGANHADWIFCLVRTDFSAPKHDGISFLLFSMDSPGVSTRPIQLISGSSSFCQTFFDDVLVPKQDLVHKAGQGWTVGKRLLQHERSGLAQLASADQAGPMERIMPALSLPAMARYYLSHKAGHADADQMPWGKQGQALAQGAAEATTQGVGQVTGQQAAEDAQLNAGELTDPALRDDIVRYDMAMRAFKLTQQRTLAESEANTPGATTSIFKYMEAVLVKQQLEIQLRIRGTQAFGWEGSAFTEEEIRMCRLWLEAKAISIAGGSNEIQLNIIAKRVLGLPD